MPIKVKQESIYQGNDWWQWSVWLEGSKAELDQIEYVEYTLHPTFAKPVQRITDRNTNFRLDASGWGEFMIYLKIQQQSGAVLERKHWLKLEYSKSQQKRTSATKAERPTLFLSSGIADAQFARALSRALQTKGIKVVMSADVSSSDAPWETTINSLLDQANQAAVIVSERPTSWLMREVQAAQDRKIPVTLVTVGPELELPGTFRDLPNIHVEKRTDEKSMARQVVEQLKLPPAKEQQARAKRR